MKTTDDARKRVKEALREREEVATQLVAIDEKKRALMEQIGSLDEEQRQVYEQALSVGWTSRELSSLGISKQPKKRHKKPPANADHTTENHRQATQEQASMN